MSVLGVSSLPAARIRSGSACDDRLAVDRTEADDDRQVLDGRQPPPPGSRPCTRGTPTSRSQASRAHTISVFDGARLTMRCRLRLDHDLAAGVIGQRDRVLVDGLALGVAVGPVASRRSAGAVTSRLWPAGSQKQGKEDENGGAKTGAHGDAFPFTRGFGHRDLAGRPGSRTQRSGYSCGTAPAFTGFAIHPPAFRRRHPSRSSVGGPMLSGQ